MTTPAPGSEGGGQLMVNEYEATISYPMMVFLNLDQYEYGLRKRELYFERAIEAAAALCLMASRDRQAVGIILYTPWRKPGEAGEQVSFIAPAPFTLVPILERLAVIERASKKEASGLGSEAARAKDDAITIKGSAQVLLEYGKRLPYGTRLIYAGPDLGDESYISLNMLKRQRITLEYVVIDERSVFPLVPGGSRRYAMQESGYDLI
jgi:hypothetical protein